MKKIALTLILALASAAGLQLRANVPDSVFIYLYTDMSRGGHDGLHWAWSADGERWQSPAPWQKLVSSDYGTWGGEKRMLAPFVQRGRDGVWHALWSVNERDATFAVARSENLIDWHPQTYPAVSAPGRNCIDPEARAEEGGYLVSWLETAGSDTAYMACVTPDFKTFSAARTVPGMVRKDARVRIKAVAEAAEGTVARISRAELRALTDHAEAEAARSARYGENARTDSVRFASLAPVKASLRTRTSEPYAISPLLMGIFFEDISRAADGGLYAELVQNRDFEYDPADRSHGDPTWTPRHSWSVRGEGLAFDIATESPAHANNPHYAAVRSAGRGGALANAGFGGIAVRKGEKYDIALLARSAAGTRKLRAVLAAPDGRELASATVAAPRGRWGRVGAELRPSASCDSATLLLEPAGEAQMDIDMVSLFPRATFHGRRNGLRADLADTIAALRPRFVRFPGGCVAHGDGIGNIYRWKNTIGPLESRVPQRNLWGYHQTAGLGYHEYFEFCEDLGAEPLPVVAAGVPCQNSSCGGAGQQGGIPMDEMKAYVQDVLDLIEYANGDARTTEWGRRRALNGHPEPFGMKYLGVGNEDLISDVFKERFAMIFRAVRERYPEITVIGTAGPFHSGSDYDEGWEFATALGVSMVDEHYYESPAWFIYNQNYYDGYDRSRAKVYLGEYASRGNSMYNALAEAAYLCAVERNADVVAMTSYAPLLAKEGQTNWNPDMIYFTNTEVHPTPNYRVQRLFGENCGTSYVPSQLDVESGDAAVRARVAASVVTDGNGDMVVKLVNILPVPVSVSTDLPAVPATITTLSGAATSTAAPQPQVREAAGGEPAKLELPPYSLTIIRCGK